MVKQLIIPTQRTKDISAQGSSTPGIKDQSTSIHKQSSLTSKKTAITNAAFDQQALYLQQKRIAALQQVVQQPLIVTAAPPQATTAMVVPTIYNGANVIQLVPQIAVQARPVQYTQVLVPIIQTARTVTIQGAEEKNRLAPQKVESEGCEKSSSLGCCSHGHAHTHKKANAKGGVTAQSSSGHTSAALTAPSNGSLSESEEVEIEIPGGFDNIKSFENDMSCSNGDESSEYVTLPKLDKWIGLDWDEVSITSDTSQNRQDWLRGTMNSHLACSICCRKFRTHEELLAHELSHESENPFKCPHMFCTSRYDKGQHLKSHIRKRHPKQWPKFEQALLKCIETEKCDEVALLLQPSDSMLEAMQPSTMI